MINQLMLSLPKFLKTTNKSNIKDIITESTKRSGWIAGIQSIEKQDTNLCPAGGIPLKGGRLRFHMLEHAQHLSSENASGGRGMNILRFQFSEPKSPRLLSWITSRGICLALERSEMRTLEFRRRAESLKRRARRIFSSEDRVSWPITFLILWWPPKCILESNYIIAS